MSRLTTLTLCTVFGVGVALGTAHAQSSTVGRWVNGPVFPVAPIHMQLLPSGKVMFYPGNNGISGDDARTWDPSTGQIVSLSKAGYDLFCSGHSGMQGGSMLVTGGHVDLFVGLPYASVYNSSTNVWNRTPDMNAGRWYPTTTTMGLGDVLVMTGFIDTVQLENPLPQVYEPWSGTWRNLTNAMLRIFSYSWVFWTPWGNALVAGPEQQTRTLDVSGQGAWSTVATYNYPEFRDYGSAVMYDPWRVMIAGGGQPPTNTAEVFNVDSNTWQSTGSMAIPRRHHNLVLLPDDTVLAVGGSKGPGFNDTTQPVLPSELWNPATGTWKTMASQRIGRFYHSVAMLLPNGRVISAGGDFNFQTELYSPPYLFKGTRPTISSAPQHAYYTETFFVGTPNASSITNVRLIRLGAVTHAFDQSQRILRLNFTKTATGLNVTAPSSQNQAPPGHYMLFILNGSGVPSVAKIIAIDDEGHIYP